MEVHKIAAFSHNNKGGNPAGVAICKKMPPDSEMLNVAKQIGYSETAFLQKVRNSWRIRYFAPEIEVPFCGHATIASGAVLGERFGVGEYTLILNDNEIGVTVLKSEDGTFTITLQSPTTWSKPAAQEYVMRILSAFSLSTQDLDTNFPVHIAFAGAKHFILFLKDRQKLSEMSYHFDRLKKLMIEEDLTTINMLWKESNKLFHSRNPFPPGGVYEDPATGAAAAALAGYLRDQEWTENSFSVLQGEEMGYPSRIAVRYTMQKGEGVMVSGEARRIKEEKGGSSGKHIL